MSSSRTMSSNFYIAGTKFIKFEEFKSNKIHRLNSRTGNEILVGSTVKKKWNKVKNRIFKKDEDANKCSNGNGWKDLISEKCLNISYFNIDNP